MGLASAAVLLAAWSCTTLVPGPSSLMVLAAVLAPLIVVPAVPLVTVAVRYRRWVSATLGLAAAVVPWVFVVGYSVPDPAVGRDSLPVRVLTLNTDVGRADATQIVAAVRARAVDVLVLTELTATLVADLHSAGLEAVLQPRFTDLAGGPVAGIGVWTRQQVADAGPVTGLTWPAARVVLRTAAGELTVIACHVSAPVPHFPYVVDTPSWQRDLRTVGEVAGATPGRHAVVGDLNATIWNSDFRALLRTGLRDASDVAGSWLNPTWPTWVPTAYAPLDHVLVGAGVGVASSGTVEVAGSDHRAAWADLSLPM